MNENLTKASKQELIARIKHLEAENEQQQKKQPDSEVEDIFSYCRSIIDYAGFGVVVISDGEIVFVNNYGTRISGYTKNEIIAMDATQRLQCIHHHFRKLIHKSFQSFFHNGTKSLKTPLAAVYSPKSNKTG